MGSRYISFNLLLGQAPGDILLVVPNPRRRRNALVEEIPLLAFLVCVFQVTKPPATGKCEVKDEI